MIFDTKQQWFTSNFIGAQTFFTTSMGQGDIIEREWADGDWMISQKVTISEKVFEQTLMKDELTIVQRADLAARTWLRKLTTEFEDVYSKQWSFLPQDHS